MNMKMDITWGTHEWWTSLSTNSSLTIIPKHQQEDNWRKNHHPRDDTFPRKKRHHPISRVRESFLTISHLIVSYHTIQIFPLFLCVWKLLMMVCDDSMMSWNTYSSSWQVNISSSWRVMDLSVVTHGITTRRRIIAIMTMRILMMRGVILIFKVTHHDPQI